ncbi:glycosyltransferase family 2 protein [Candidatus Beckwithbacteria bacterium]|nr:glycosyltransferase family 2 protein [Candidatus Beckwithbacteria bacterium]
MKTDISIIIPVYNEEGNISKLFQKIQAIFEKIDKTWEIIFINDGSSDKSEAEILNLSKNNPQIKLISFVRNFGQTAAWSAGFDYAQGKILITMDADLQNDPEDIPMMLEIMEKEKADIVNGWRKNRQDPFLRSIVSKMANKIINWMMESNIKDSGCSLRIIKKSAIQDLKLYGEMHRLLPFLLAGYGAKTIQIPVKHHPRIIGKSKYGFSRTFKVLLDMITIKFLISYQTKPIYMFGQVGFGFLVLSVLTALLVIVRRIFFNGAWISPLFFVMSNFFTVGILCVLMGLLAEIQVRSWFEGTGKKPYLIKKMS